MKRLLFLLVFLSACKKEKYAEQPTELFNFALSRPHNLCISQNGQTELLVSIEKISGKNENVEISMEGLPQEITYQVNKLPDNNDSLFLISLTASQTVAVGKYFLNVVVKSSSAGEKKRALKLFVSAIDECGVKIAGLYADEAYNSAYVTEEAAGMITINKNVEENFYETEKITAFVNCESKTLLIPAQNDLSGSGTFDDSTINLEITDTSNGMHDIKHITYRRRPWFITYN